MCLAFAAGILVSNRIGVVEGQQKKTPGEGFAAVPGAKGGNDAFGPYDPVQNWPRPLAESLPNHEAWTYSQATDIFPETPDRVLVTFKGELPVLPGGRGRGTTWLPQIGPSIKFPVGGGVPTREAASATPSFGKAVDESDGRPGVDWRWEHVIQVFDRNGKMIEDWSQWDRIWGRPHDVVVVTLNHRLNVFGYTHLGDAMGSDFAASSSVGLLDIVAALEWVRDNISGFGGDPNLVTIFGQSGGGRKVATLMSMPGAKALFHRAIIESGAVLRLTTHEDASKQTDLLLAELGLKRGQIRELQNVSMARLLAADAAVQQKITPREPGMTPNSPMVDGKVIPGHPWDPKGPPLSATIPLLIGYAHTEETLYDRPTPEKLALNEAGLKERASKRLGVDPTHVIETFRQANPQASPCSAHTACCSHQPTASLTGR